MNENVERSLVPKSQGLNPWMTIWRNPRRTIRQQIDYSNYGWLFLFACLAGVSMFLDAASTANLSDKAGSNAAGVIVNSLFLGPILGLIVWLLQSVIFWGAGKIFGGEATFKEMQYVVGWSYIPLILSLILWIPDIGIMGNDTFSEDLSSISTYGATVLYFTALLELIIGVWYWVILIKGVAEAHDFSAWKGLAVVFLPIVFLFLLFLLAIITS